MTVILDIAPLWRLLRLALPTIWCPLDACSGEPAPQGVEILWVVRHGPTSIQLPMRRCTPAL
jgi:hypothetical protein